jgi:protein involved in polysaccharide export with SLBB domain
VPRTNNSRGAPRRPLRVLLGVLAVLAAAGGVATLDAQSPSRRDSDFQVGDRIVLRVAGEPQLTDTFTVSAGPALVLPFVGSISLAGVQRDSVEKVLTVAIAKYYREPSVRARALMRVAVLGEVVRPGFYGVLADMLLPDVIMAAGGPTAFAQIDGLRILRGGVEFMPKDSTKNAVARGLTLAQLGVRPEDQFVVPRTADSEARVRLVSAWIAIPTAILTVVLLLSRH